MRADDWRPSAEELRAVKAAARHLHLHDDWMWRDDLMQAALIDLWQKREKRSSYKGSQFAIAFGFARLAMRQEWRRIMTRHEGKKGKPGEPVDFAELDVDLVADHETPEAAAERHECIRVAMQLPGPLAQAVAARLEHDSMREAAEALGLDHACMQTRLYRALRALGDSHAGLGFGWRADRRHAAVPNCAEAVEA
jgi:DNA-directed RNA polymerase specialized sigma24 family protein